MFPYIFKIGNFELRYYSLMYLLGILISIYFVKRRGKSLGLDPQKIENIILFTFLGAILGARMYYVFFKWEFYKNTPLEMFAIWHGGLAIHGGVLGGVITLFFLSKLNKFKMVTLGDLIVPFLLLSQGIGRFGNFANGEAHGVPTITPLSIIFSIKNRFPEFWANVLNILHLDNNPVSISKITSFIDSSPVNIPFENTIYHLKYYVPWGVSFPPKYLPPAYMEFGTLPVHPTFFYEMILNFIGAFILIYLWRNDQEIGRGRLMGLYLIFYGFIRAFVTFFRADDLMIGFLRAPHLASLVMIIIGLIMVLGGKKDEQR